MTDLTCVEGSRITWSSTESHSESSRIRFGDDTAGFQVKISDAARHGKPPINVSLAHAVPRHKAAKVLYPKHKYKHTHTQK